jgi:hypothetical protein
VYQNLAAPSHSSNGALLVPRHGSELRNSLGVRTIRRLSILGVRTEPVRPRQEASALRAQDFLPVIREGAVAARQDTHGSAVFGYVCEPEPHDKLFTPGGSLPIRAGELHVHVAAAAPGLCRGCTRTRICMGTTAN